MKNPTLQEAVKLHRNIYAELQRDRRNGRPCTDIELLEAWSALHRSIWVTKEPQQIIEAARQLKEVLGIPETMYA